MIGHGAEKQEITVVLIQTENNRQVSLLTRIEKAEENKTYR